jgi:hypothetical protein
VHRHRQVDLHAANGRGAIVEIAAERALARIEVDRRHPAAGGGQRNRAVHRRRDLPVPPFSLAKTMKCGLSPAMFTNAPLPYRARPWQEAAPVTRTALTLSERERPCK